MKLTIITATIIKKVLFLSPHRGKCQRMDGGRMTKGVIEKVLFLSPHRGKCLRMDGGRKTKGVKILHRSCYIEVDVKF